MQIASHGLVFEAYHNFDGDLCINGVEIDDEAEWLDTYHAEQLPDPRSPKSIAKYIRGESDWCRDIEREIAADQYSSGPESRYP